MPSLYSWAVFACSLLPHTVVSMPQTAVLVPALQPVIQGPASAGPAPSCGGCVVVADVAGLVWYKEIFVNTIGTEFRSVGFTNNRTRTTSTIFRSAEAGFTYTPNGAPNSAAPTPLINFGPFYTIGGATL